MSAGAWSRAWPHLRALLVLFHCSAVVVLSLPGSSMLDRARWRSENLKSDFAGWSSALSKVGVTIPPEELGVRVRGVAERYLRVRSLLVAPFGHYPRLSGANQGWAMFASPQRHPAEVHVDVLEAGAWRPLFRPRDPAASWQSGPLTHHRMRKLMGRFAREYRDGVFSELAAFLASRAFSDVPAAERVRVRLYRYDSLPPERVQRGERPQGRYAERREWGRAELR